ncbi:hypothetical protein D9611_004248 [Ephemerocybe angulata]|uniref:NTF2 domain-containing protein n=1 Tax=Ephemerocybe angulata TaxID=980116 RepID=A0A8H5BKI0_9AGAR|nr:hypothetical protein D9611_004248 [Tulosesus angulatus]
MSDPELDLAKVFVKVTTRNSTKAQKTLIYVLRSYTVQVMILLEIGIDIDDSLARFSKLSCEGECFEGKSEINEKLTIEKHIITTMDAHLLSDRSLMTLVDGELKVQGSMDLVPFAHAFHIVADKKSVSYNVSNHIIRYKFK